MPEGSPPESVAETVTVEFPTAFWEMVLGIAKKSGVTPETVISAGTSLFSLAQQAKANNQKMAIVEADQDCITEIKGL
ncbi:MAG: hypothetical protein AAGB01_09710 [Cyanobacteria bacterium P01_F01_bin.42]